ncbi:MAG: CHAT domain-containing protein [Thermoanaerobaculia bacterium]
MAPRRCQLFALFLATLPAALVAGTPGADAERSACGRLNDSGRYAEALPHCQSAAETQRSASARLRGETDAGALGQSLNSLGLALEMTGDRRAAEAAYLEALARHRALQLHELEALVLSNLAALAIGGGDYRGALAWLGQEEAVARQAIAGGAEDWPAAELDYVRINRSVALEQLGAYAEALAELRPISGPALAQDSGSGDSAETAALTVNLAVLYRNLGDPRRALVLLDRARVAYERLGDRSALANVHLNRALVQQLNLRSPEPAAGELAVALDLVRASGDRGEEARILCAQGELRLHSGDLTAARQAFSLALKTAAAADAVASRWTAEAGLGRVARAAGDSATALAHLRAAIAGIEQVGANLESSALRGGLLADQRAVYAAAVDLLAESALATPEPGRGAAALEALALAEQARARELLEALGGAAAEPLSPKAILALTPRLGATLVYFFGERRLWRWQAAGGAWSVAVAGEPKAVGRLVARTHRHLANAEVAEADDLAQLARQLLPAGLPSGGELRIVPDGRLFYLPFELLPATEGGDVIIERFAVSYLPSLSVFAHLRVPAANPRWRLAALADPALPAAVGSGEAGTFASLLVRRFGLPALPGAAREVRSAARFLGEPSAVDLGDAASEARLRQRATEGARVLHIAAHTVVDEGLAGGVALFLAATSDSDSASDGLVTAPELARMPLAADLAILSGCRTAIAETSANGSTSDGRGLASLSGALLGAGASGVVASLWQVGDAATAVLMEQFYFELAEGARPAEALRRAKLRLAGDARWNAAPAWAGFVLLGDPGPVAQPPANWRWLAAALAAAGVLLLGARRRRASQAGEKSG